VAGAVVELFKSADELRAKAPISERIADISLRLFIAAAALATGLVMLAGASALFGWGLSVAFKSISLATR
jgi:hypothetical protein